MNGLKDDIIVHVNIILGFIVNTLMNLSLSSGKHFLQI